MAKTLRQTVALTGGYLAATSVAAADAHTPTISGNAWVALAIIIGFVAIIYFVIMGALHIETRDARLGKDRSTGHDRWYGVFGSGSGDDDDDDHHHFHHMG